MHTTDPGGTVTATPTPTRQPEWLAALTALVPDELRDDARDVTQQLRSLYDTALPICERALTIMEQLQSRMRRAEEEMVEVVGEDHRGDVHDASWKITNAISGETH